MAKTSRQKNKRLEGDKVRGIAASLPAFVLRLGWMRSALVAAVVGEAKLRDVSQFQCRFF
jgi:hypothetical protein